MDTNTGRFISQDSYAGSVYDPASLHKYLYANSNPVMYSDPSGYIPAVEGNLALALAGDEYAMNRLAIQMTTSEMGYYSRDPRSIGQHVSDVLFIGLAIIAAITAIVININMMYEQMDTVITDCSSGNTTSAEANTEYRDSKCNNSTNEPVRRNYLDTDADFDDILVSISGTQFRQNDVDGWIKDNRVPSNLPKQAGRWQSKGGRHEPANLNEKLAMEEVMTNPECGMILVGKNNGSIWPAEDGWKKWAQNVHGYEIHYQYNPLTGEIDDVKIK